MANNQSTPSQEWTPAQDLNAEEQAIINAEEEAKQREKEARKAEEAKRELAQQLAAEHLAEKAAKEAAINNALKTEVESTPQTAETVTEEPVNTKAEETEETTAKEETKPLATAEEPKSEESKVEEPKLEAPAAEEETSPEVTETTEEEPEAETLEIATTFAELPLIDSVQTAVKEAGYTSPTEIQAKAIPVIMSKQDVIGASQTGTGKTAAFALPSISLIKPLGKPQILVLEPTRELAVQVAEQFTIYAKGSGLTVTTLFGGVGYGSQSDDLAKGADIVIACPGRLVDMFYKGLMRFGEIKILILDEVDRMLDMGFLPTVKKIVNLCPWDERQTLFFSATMPPAIKSFSDWCLTNAKEITVARKEVASTISHSFYPVSMDQRDELILALVKETDFKSMMIFTRTRSEANSLAALIEQAGHQVAAMHSDIKQSDRQKALEGFKEGVYKVLVATDVAARGIDVSSVTHVINYRVPENPEDYVHRIGRTGRAKSEGDAYTILSADELEQAAAVEGFIGQKIKRSKLENFDYLYTALLDESPQKKKARRKNSSRKRRR